MTWQAAAAVGLLAIGVGIELLSCLGMLLMDDVFNRLHFAGPATIVGPLAVAAAVLAAEALSSSGITTLLTALVLVVTSPVLTHATARAARARRLREQGTWPGKGAEDG